MPSSLPSPSSHTLASPIARLARFARAVKHRALSSLFKRKDKQKNTHTNTIGRGVSDDKEGDCGYFAQQADQASASQPPHAPHVGTVRRQRQRQRVHSLPPSLILEGLGGGLEESVKEGLEKRYRSQSSCGLLTAPMTCSNSNRNGNGMSSNQPMRTSDTTTNTTNTTNTTTVTTVTNNTANTMINSTSMSASTITADSSIIKLVDFSGVDDDLQLFTQGQNYLSPNVLLFHDVADEIHDARLVRPIPGRFGVAESHYGSLGTCGSDVESGYSSTLGDCFGRNTIARRNTVKAMYGVDAA